MELNDLFTTPAHEAGAEMRVRDMLGNETDCYLLLVGMDSKAWQNASIKHRRSLIEPDADLYELKIQFMTDATIGWRGFTDQGNELEFSKEKAEQLYRSAPYIVEQADQFIGNRANFMKGKAND